jgi:hypothetical protein
VASPDIAGGCDAVRNALIALLVAGAAILLTGSTLSGTMIGFMRPTKTTISVGAMSGPAAE